MAKICPRCGGLEVGCPVCDLPPRHVKPKDRKLVALRAAFGLFTAPSWEVQGVDVSAWNGVMDFSITRTKCQFAIVRLGYGNEWKDARCDNYRQQLIDNDMPYGVYWYCKPGQNWEMHAEHFAEVASEFPFQLEMDEDYEQTFLDPIGTLDWIIACDKRIIQLMHRLTEPYSSAGFWDDNVAPNTYFKDPHWIANWTTAPSPYVPRGWTWNKGDKWQHSADGNNKAKEYGMISDGDPDMDLDRWYGTVPEFNLKYGTHILPIGVLPPGELPDVVYPTVNLNIRSTPDSRNNTNVIGSALYNTRWHPIAVAIGPDYYGIMREWWQIGKYAYIAKWLTRWS